MSCSQPYLNTVRNFPVELSSEWSLMNSFQLRVAFQVTL